MLRNMVTSLIYHERIQTTVPKAKELKYLAEEVIGLGKQGEYFAATAHCCRVSTIVYHSSSHAYVNNSVIIHEYPGTIHARQRANEILREKPALTKLFEILGPRYKDRQGGYTRILQLARPRQGDKAPMAVIEYIDRPGEIRAARPPKSRRTPVNLSEVLACVGIRPITEEQQPAKISPTELGGASS